jgi:hypothetical protein
MTAVVAKVGNHIQNNSLVTTRKPHSENINRGSSGATGIGRKGIQ